MSYQQDYIQRLSNEFNKDYVRAGFSSQPTDWMLAALAARQLVDELANMGILQDNFHEVYKKEQEITGE